MRKPMISVPFNERIDLMIIGQCSLFIIAWDAILDWRHRFNQPSNNPFR
jgi:hypothetical protein